jgi:perosamine synthetase
MSKNQLLGDASGRGAVAGYRVTCPAMQHPYTEAEIAAVVKVMREACGQTQGKYMVEFEKAFSEFTGAKHAFAVANCTDALKMAAIFCHIQPGDEVIVPAYTFCASAIPFGDLGAKLVWGDINPDTWTIDPDDIARKITSKTKAIVCVHLLGMPCDMKKIVPLAKAHGIKVVEDCAQALDCRIDGQHVGTFGDFGCFSFHSAKTMTTLGEGGMFVCASDEDAAAAPGIRHNGACGFEGERKRYWSPAMSNVDSFLDDRWPQNYCIGEAQCALGTEELKSVTHNNNTLIAQDKKIREWLKDVPEIEFSKCIPGGRYVVHQYIMHYNPMGSGKTRDDLLDLMTEKYGVRCIVQYYPLYRYPLFQKKGDGDFDCPVLEKWWDNSFSFPWWCNMDDESMKIMCESLIAAVKELRK